MSIKTLKINGFRGFSEETAINFAIPDNKNPGSGLTILIGPNNSGKSTVIEAVHLLNSNNINIIPKNSRNIKTEGKVSIEVEDIKGNTISINSIKNKGAFIKRKRNGEEVQYINNDLNAFILSNKRNFTSTFNNNSYQSRENYKGNIGENDYRNENYFNSNFGGRLLNIYTNIEAFNSCLEKVLSPLPDWTIESYDNNNLFLEFNFNGIKHSSKGAGDGYINIFNIVDALYDSSENNVILIDEPEVSLHPDLQRKLFALLVEYSKDKQIIISTHSPYFVDWKLISEYAKIIRFKKVNDTIKMFELSDLAKDSIKKIVKDNFQPHTLSLDSNEIFFLNDNIILTEGQDDVICYKEIFKQFEYETKASFFGWGAGGAPRVEYILNILKDLGYEKVFTIFDNDQREKTSQLKDLFPEYEFYAIPTDDVRNKIVDKKIKDIIGKIKHMQIEETQKEEIINCINLKYKDKEGLVKDMANFEINKKYEEDIKELLNNISNYFNKEYTHENKISINGIKGYDDETLSKQLLDKWLMKNNNLENDISKFSKFEFHSGNTEIISNKRIKDNKYFVIIKKENSITEDHNIVIYYYLLINLKKEKIKLKRKQIIKNTLPISKFSKLLFKIII